MNREDILLMIQNIMLDMFEIESKSVTLEARLSEDLDFDSIDAVDMIVKLKEVTGKAINADDFKIVRTIDDVVEVVYQLTHH